MATDYPNLTIQMEERKPELLPCPFCGWDASTSHGVEGRMRLYFFVACDRCHCRTKKFFKWTYGEEYEQEAIKAWNTRTPKESEEGRMNEELQKYVAENEALKCELAKCSDRYQKAEFEKEQLEIKIEECEKTIQFHLGQIEAYKHCIDTIRR